MAEFKWQFRDKLPKNVVTTKRHLDELVETDISTGSSQSSPEDSIANERGLVPAKRSLSSFKFREVKCLSCQSNESLVCEHIIQANYTNVTNLRWMIQAKGQTLITLQDIPSSRIEFKKTKLLPSDLQKEFCLAASSKDGNCFFDSISIALTGGSGLTSVLRKCSFYEYIQRRTKYDQYLHKFNYDPSDNTFQRLFKDAHYSGEDSAFVLCNAIGRRINWVQKINTRNGQSIIKECYYPFISDPRAKPVYIYFDSVKRHFYPLIPRDFEVELNKGWRSNGDICIPVVKDSIAKNNSPGCTEIDVRQMEDAKKPDSQKKSQKSAEQYFREMWATFSENLKSLLEEKPRDKDFESLVLESLTTFDLKGWRDNFMNMLRDVIKKHLSKKDFNKIYLRVMDYCNLPTTKIFIRDSLRDLQYPEVIVEKYEAQHNMIHKTKPAEVELEDEYASSSSSDCAEVDDDENKMVISAVREIFKLTDRDLKYVPEKLFNLQIPYDILRHIFDFKKRCFIPNAWAAGIQICFYNNRIPCGITAKSEPKMHSSLSSSFCTLRVECKCGMQYNIKVMTKPVKGKDCIASVQSNGVFTLIQSKNCSRPVTNFERNQMAKKLANTTAYSMYLTDMHHLDGLRALHNNPGPRTASVLRVIKSEQKRRKLKNQSISEEVEYLQKQYLQSVYSDQKIKGYIHLNSRGENIQIHTYDYGSLNLHRLNLMKKKQLLTLHLDATGEVFKNPANKQLLLYHLLGKTVEEHSYPIAQMLSQTGNNVAIGNFLSTVGIELKQIYPSMKKPLGDIIVCDFSFAMLHGISRGVNHEELTDYIQRADQVLCKSENSWRKEKCIIFICTAHLMNALKKNLAKSIAQTRNKAQIIRLALCALGRLQECNFDEFSKVSNDIMMLFDSKYLPEHEGKRLKSSLESKSIVSFVENLPETSLACENVFDFQKDSNKSLQSCSSFYQKFMDIRQKVKLIIANQGSTDKNKYYCPIVVDCIQKYKIAMFPFWNGALVRAVKQKTFVRETNAVIENYFRNIKKTLKFSPANTYADYLRDIYQYHDGQVRNALLKVKSTTEMQNTNKISRGSTSNNKLGSDMEKEKWKRSKAGRKVNTSKYLSPKGPSTSETFHFAPKENPGKCDEDEIQENIEETEKDLKLYQSSFGSFLTAAQFVVLLKNEYLQLPQIQAYTDYLRDKLPPMVDIISPQAIFKVGNQWDGTMLQPNTGKPLNILKNRYHYLLPVCCNKHWVLVHFHVLNKTIELFDSGWEGCINEIELQNMMLNEVLQRLGLDKTGWKFQQIETPKQSDGFNCGVHVLCNIASLLEDQNYPVLEENVSRKRLRFAYQMLNSSELGKELTVKSGYDSRKLIEVLEDMFLTTDESVE